MTDLTGAGPLALEWIGVRREGTRGAPEPTQLPRGGGPPRPVARRAAAR